jgi:hypothetical protein
MHPLFFHFSVDKEQFGLQVLLTLNEVEVSGLGQIEIGC